MSENDITKELALAVAEKCLCDSKHSCTKSSSDLASDTYE